MNPEVEIGKLLRATAAGDHRAFHLLYDSMSPRLFGITLKVCRDHSVAEDVLQEVFTEIWRKAHTYNTARGEAGAWLNVIARSRSVDALRRQRRGIVGATTGSDDEMNAAPDPAISEDGGVDYLTMMSCLDRLDERPRELILRAYYRGESREEMSRAFNTPVNTIKTWLRRGLIDLKKCLDE